MTFLTLIRSILRLGSIALLSCFSLSLAGHAKETSPNVILIFVDDMGWMDLTCQGSDFYKTPSIDRLAKEGMRFTNGYAACAVCSPTRAAVQTGRYPHRLGVTDWIRSLSEEDRKLVIHCGLEGLSYIETGERLAIGKEAVAKRWQRLREKLRDQPIPQQLFSEFTIS